ncbi:MAG: TonB-dependent receptor [Myxococcota bacterium]
MQRALRVVPWFAGAALLLVAPRPAAAEGLEDIFKMMEDEENFDSLEDLVDVEALDLEKLLDVVYTGTKRAQPENEVPSVVSVITASEIRQRGYRSVGDALRHLPGFHVINDLVYHSVGIRGLWGANQAASENLKVMINGQPTSFRPTAVNLLGNDLIPIEAVQRIEIIRGPISALYGANAVLGVVNVITWSGRESDRPNAQVGGDGFRMQNELRGTRNGRVFGQISGQLGGFAGFLSLSHREANRSGLVLPGFEDRARSVARDDFSDPTIQVDGFPSPGTGVDARRFMFRQRESRRDHASTSSAYGLASYSLSDSLELTFDGHFQRSDKGAEFQDLTFLSRSSNITHENAFARIALDYGSLRQQGLTGYASVAVAGGRPLDNERIAERLQPDRAYRRDLSYQSFDLTGWVRYGLGESHGVTVGIDYTVDEQDLLNTEVFDLETGEILSAEGFDAETFANFGIYAQYEVAPFDWLSFTLGTRADRNSFIACDANQWDCVGSRPDIEREASLLRAPDVTITDRGNFQLSNRAALVANFGFWSSYAKLIYGSAFKPPSPFQLFNRSITRIASTVGSPALKPHTADTFEVAVGAEPLAGFKVEANLFHTRVDDFVLYFEDDSQFLPRNGNTETTGAEFSISARPSTGLTLVGSAGLLLQNQITPLRRADEPEFEFESSPFNEQVDLGGYASVIMHGVVNYAMPQRYLNINVTASYVGDRDSRLQNTQLFNLFNINEPYEIDDFVNVDVTVSTIGFNPFELGETVISLSLRGVPGAYVEPGLGGVDIPSLGPRVHLMLEQQL